METAVAKIDHAWVENLSAQERKELQRLLLKLLRMEGEEG